MPSGRIAEAWTDELEALRVLASAERPLRAVEVADRAGLNRSSVRVYLLRLLEAGCVSFRGERTLRAWSVTRRGAARADPARARRRAH